MALALSTTLARVRHRQSFHYNPSEKDDRQCLPDQRKSAKSGECFRTQFYDEKPQKTGGCIPTGSVFVGAVAWRFTWFKENDINPQVIQAGRVEGPGRG